MKRPLKPVRRPLILALALVPGLPVAALESAELGLLINEADPLSVSIGNYYTHRRAIPAENFIRIVIETKKPRIDAARFTKI